MMRTLLQIIEKAGGWRHSLYLKIDNPPFMELVIEAMDESGPLGLPSLSVCHYGEQNGDLMRDPEMCFEVVCAEDRTLSLNPWYFRNDYLGLEQWSRNIVRGQYVCIAALHKQRHLQPYPRGAQSPRRPATRRRKAGKAIAEFLTAPEPPLHLLLGPDAFEYVNKELDTLRAELDAWQRVTRSTNFDDAA
jgi:hypothetical protein